MRSTPLAVWTTAIADEFRVLPICTAHWKEPKRKTKVFVRTGKQLGGLGLPDSFDWLAALQPDGEQQSFVQRVKLAVNHQRY